MAEERSERHVLAEGDRVDLLVGRDLPPRRREDDRLVVKAGRPGRLGDARRAGWRRNARATVAESSLVGERRSGPGRARRRPPARSTRPAGASSGRSRRAARRGPRPPGPRAPRPRRPPPWIASDSTLRREAPPRGGERARCDEPGDEGEDAGPGDPPGATTRADAVRARRRRGRRRGRSRAGRASRSIRSNGPPTWPSAIPASGSPPRGQRVAGPLGERERAPERDESPGAGRGAARRRPRRSAASTATSGDVAGGGELERPETAERELRDAGERADREPRGAAGRRRASGRAARGRGARAATSRAAGAMRRRAPRPTTGPTHPRHGVEPRSHSRAATAARRGGRPARDAGRDADPVVARRRRGRAARARRRAPDPARPVERARRRTGGTSRASAGRCVSSGVGGDAEERRRARARTAATSSPSPSRSARSSPSRPAETRTTTSPRARRARPLRRGERRRGDEATARPGHEHAASRERPRAPPRSTARLRRHRRLRPGEGDGHDARVGDRRAELGELAVERCEQRRRGVGRDREHDRVGRPPLTTDDDARSHRRACGRAPRRVRR